MPPIDERGHDHDRGDDEDEDDGMPPLVDNPTTNPPINYTFYSEMTPASFSTSSTSAAATFQHRPEPHLPHTPQTPQPPPEQPIASSSSSSVVAPPRGSHSKKRDASYIPRPPNAFILYRSSFIKSQQVTDKVEGNHSNLSKIIGKYWKTLPQAERDEWEAKAVLAQAEHRARYPDWRFRPGANALAKLKAGANADARTKGGGTTRSRASVKEKGKAKEVAKDKKGKEKERTDAGALSADVDADTGGHSGPSKRRRVNTQPKHPSRSRSGSGLGQDAEDGEGRGGGGDGDDDAYEPPAEEPKRKRGRGASVAGGLVGAGSKTATDTRCAKIVDLLGEGKTGVALEVAVKEWEGGRKRARKRELPEKESAPVADVSDKSGDKSQEGVETSSTVRGDGEMAAPTASVVPADGHVTRNPPHLHIPPQHTYAQPSPTASSVRMLSPTRSPTSSYTQPASPYTQTTASPYTQTPASASPYAQTPPSPHINPAPSYSQHSRSKSLLGRFPIHEAPHSGANEASPIQAPHSQSHPPTYTRATRSSPGGTRSNAQYVHAVRSDSDPHVQGPNRLSDLAAYTADALSRGTPLTQLFRRSLSAPASENRLAYPGAQDGEVAGNTEGSGRRRTGDGPVEPSHGALNPTFSFGGSSGHPPLPLPQSHVNARTPAHPQHIHASSRHHAYSTSHLPTFPQTHKSQQNSRPPPRSENIQYHDHNAQQQSQQGSPNPGMNPPRDPHTLTWMDEEHRRRVEAAREHGYWWDGNGGDGGTDTDAEGDVDEAVGDEGLGYEDASNKEFDAAYSQHYSGSGNYTRDDGRSGWARVAGRHGLIVASEDPYLRRKSRSRSTTPPSKSQPLPPTVPIPAGDLPLSDALMATNQYSQQHLSSLPHIQQQLEPTNVIIDNYFAPYHHHSPIASAPPVPKSSFSSLAGWDGGSGMLASKWTSGSGWESGAWGSNMVTGTMGWENSSGETERGRELTRDGPKGMFSVAEEDEGGYDYGYRMGEMGVGAGTRGVDRGTGVLYDDEDEDGSDMVVGSPPGS